MSNMELLRILAMFLVLVVHADFYSLGTPSAADFSSSPIPSTVRVIMESVSVIAVNVFVLISGWFGIKPSIRSLGNFIFQCLFFSFGIYVVLLITGLTTLSLHGLTTCLYLTKDMGWFVKAYLGLYILSPVLNAFVEKATRRQLELFLVAFYIFQTVFSFANAAEFIMQGYSTFSFIGLYCLSRYFALYKKVECGTLWLLYVFTGLVTLNSLLYIAGVLAGIHLYDSWITNYANPLVVGAALSLVILFSKIKMPVVSFINFVGTSTFAVFLLHAHPDLEAYYREAVNYIYDGYSGMSCLLVLCMFLVLVFTISVLLDLPRK